MKDYLIAVGMLVLIVVGGMVLGLAVVHIVRIIFFLYAGLMS